MHADVETGRYGDQAACEIEDAWFETGGERIPAIEQGQPLTIVLRVRFHQAIDEPIFAAALRNEVGHTVFSTSTAWRGVQTGSFAPGDVAEVRIAMDTWFAPSHYKLTPSVARAGGGDNALDLREDLDVAPGPQHAAHGRRRRRPARVHGAAAMSAATSTVTLHTPSRGEQLKRIASLTWTLAVTDWKLRFYGSVLGYLWTLVRPFAFFGVIYVVFTEIANVGDDVKNYGLYILFSLVLFTLLRAR